MDPAPPAKKRSAWFYVGIGCVVFVVLAMVMGGVIAYGAFRMVKSVGEGLTDPNAKLATSRKLLGALPNGYTPIMTMSLPVIMDMVLLGNGVVETDGGMSSFERGFFYFRIVETEDSKKLKGFFDGSITDPEVLRRSGMNVDARDVLKRGSLSISGKSVYYVATRGEVQTGSGRGTAPGINTLMLFDCPADGKVRTGVWWMVKDPAELDLKDTVADEAALKDFLSPLTPCGR